MSSSRAARTGWRKSSYSGGNGNCVEVAQVGRRVGVRDSKTPAAPALVFSASEWAAFIQDVKEGRNDSR